jgi:hypothetical protein
MEGSMSFVIPNWLDLDKKAAYLPRWVSNGEPSFGVFDSLCINNKNCVFGSSKRNKLNK